MDANETPSTQPSLPPGHEFTGIAERSFPESVDLNPKATRQKLFVEMLAEGYAVGEAAQALGLNRSTIFRWRQDDPVFAQACKDAFTASVAILRKEAERRALKGSDKLLMFLLERYDPEQFHIAQKMEHSGAVDLASAVLAGRKRTTAPEPGSDLC